MKAVFICALALAANVVLAAAPVKVIFDTDMLTDYDDAGALACLHALADSGECEILATLSCTRKNASVATCEAINAFYGRPNIPVGCTKVIGYVGEGYSGADGNGHAKFRHVRDRYAKWVRYPDSDAAPDALEVYRKVLAAQPDRSVVICSVGFLTNLRRLVEADRPLVEKKVRLWVAMACKYPKGKEYNSSTDPESSAIALAKWPTPIVFSDFDYGRWVFAGRRLAETVTATGPVKDVFAMTLPPRASCNDGTYDRPEGHPSWDETAVLYAVRGAVDVFGTERGTYRMIGADGENEWIADEKGPHLRLIEKMPKKAVGALIDDLMCRPPSKTSL